MNAAREARRNFEDTVLKAREARQNFGILDGVFKPLTKNGRGGGGGGVVREFTDQVLKPEIFTDHLKEENFTDHLPAAGEIF